VPEEGSEFADLVGLEVTPGPELGFPEERELLPEETRTPKVHVHPVMTAREGR
jgi:hypothetical protein